MLGNLDQERRSRFHEDRRFLFVVGRTGRDERGEMPALHANARARTLGQRNLEEIGSVGTGWQSAGKGCSNSSRSTQGTTRAQGMADAQKVSDGEPEYDAIYAEAGPTVFDEERPGRLQPLSRRTGSD